MYKLLPILLFAFGLAVTTEDIYDNSYALIIGIDEYENLMSLNYGTNDAVVLQMMLISDYGFKEENTTLLLNENASKVKILSSLSQIFAKAGKNDRVIIYFSGHAETMILPSGGDMGYLIPADGNLDDVYQSSIWIESILDIAYMSYSKHILFLFDAALGGLSLDTRKRELDYSENIMHLTKERAKQVISAGGRGDYIIEKAEWGHSVFTKNLISGLSGLADGNEDGIITTTELGRYIRGGVSYDTDGMQTPQIGRWDSDNGYGEFIFKTKYRFKNNLDEINNLQMTNTRADSLMQLFKTNPDRIKELDINETRRLLANIAAGYDINSIEEEKTSLIIDENIYDDSWAIIIGINKYTNAPPLKYAVNDANAIKQLLINNFSFPKKNIRILTDKEATLSAIRRELEDVATKSNENDRVLIYFAGHGKTLTLPNGMEIGYLIPVDGDINFPYSTGLAMDNVSTISMLSKSKHMLFLMDACYSGLMAEGSRGLNKMEDEEGYINTVSNLKARQIITAGGAKQEAIEADEWQHSVFTHNLLKALDNWAADSDADGFITAGELGEYLRKTVTDDTRGKQTPEVGRFRYSESGEFVFFRSP